MKKILIVTNVITLGLLIWCWWCCCCGHHGKGGCTDVDTSRHRHTPGGCATCVQSTEVDPNHFQFEGPDAVELVGNYTRYHWQDINTGNDQRALNDNRFQGIKDSRSVWFSLSRLKGFIQEIEQQANDHLPGCCCDLGIRIYFGEYDDFLVNKFQTNTKDLSPDLQFNPPILPDYPNGRHYADKTTVILIPTYKWGADNKNHDFNPYDPALRCNITQPDSSWHGTIMALTMNHGSIVPPPYPTNTCPEYMGSGADFLIHGVDYPTTNSPNPYITASGVNCPD